MRERTWGNSRAVGVACNVGVLPRMLKGVFCLEPCDRLNQQTMGAGAKNRLSWISKNGRK
jgi:hypothetical protein